MLEGFIAMLRPEQIDGPVNLGNRAEFTILQLAREIIALTGGDGQIVESPLPADDPRQRRPDLAKAREVLGFEPKVSLRQGLQSTIRDVRERLATAQVKPLRIASVA